MGNWCGKKQVVHPEQSGRRISVSRVKVKMRVKELRELMEKVEEDGNGNGVDRETELGRLILQECLNGRLQARVTPATTVKYINQTSLPTIKEY